MFVSSALWANVERFCEFCVFFVILIGLASAVDLAREVAVGNFDGRNTRTQPSVREAEFERHVREVPAVMGTAPRFVLDVADQIPPDGLESRVRRVGEIVEESGRYR